MSNILSEVHPELVAEWSDKNLPLTPDRITYGSNKVVWWKGACGHEWQTSVKARSNGENCPICSGARVIEGINDLATLKPELADEWSSKNDPLKPTMVTTGSHKKVIWQDKYGHEWTATVKSRALNGTGCPYCSHNKILVGFNDLASQRPQIASEWSERNYPLKPDMVTVFANRKVWWRCSKGHEWNTLISTRSGGSGCPYCSGQLLLKGFNDFATTHPQLAQEWSDRNLPLTPDMINEKSRRNVWWKCRECGYEWQSVVYARVKGTVYGNRRSCWYEQRHFQQSLYYLGQIQKEMASVLPAPLFPVPSHADGRRTRRRIFEELAKRDQSVEIMAERKEYAYGRIGSDYAEIRCVRLGLNSCSGSGMAGRESR